MIMQGSAGHADIIRHGGQATSQISIGRFYSRTADQRDPFWPVS
jgi:hypothetical protein